MTSHFWELWAYAFSSELLKTFRKAVSELCTTIKNWRITKVNTKWDYKELSSSNSNFPTTTTIPSDIFMFSGKRRDTAERYDKLWLYVVFCETAKTWHWKCCKQNYEHNLHHHLPDQTQLCWFIDELNLKGLSGRVLQSWNSPTTLAVVVVVVVVVVAVVVCCCDSQVSSSNLNLK